MNTLNRIGIALLAVLLFAAPAGALPDVGPYLQDVRTTSVKVCITSSSSCVTVEYGLDATYGNSVQSCSPVYIDSLINDLFTVQITGLSPSTTYHYRVLRGGVPTSDASFTTAVTAVEPFSFVAYGDNRRGPGLWGGGTDQAHQSVVNAIVAQNPDFVVDTGDFINAEMLFGENMPTEWINFFEIELPLLSKKALFPVRGNHEDEADFYLDFFSPPEDASGTEHYYSFDYGSAHFVMINTEESYGPGSAQYTFIENDLAAHEGTGPIFAAFHKPPFSIGVHGGSGSAHDQLAPLLQDYGVDVVFNGHDHIYFRAKVMNGVYYVVTGGGGAPLYGVNLADNPDITAVAETTLHYVYVQVWGNNIYVTAKRPDGSVIDYFQIDSTANDFIYDKEDPLPGPGVPSECSVHGLSSTMSPVSQMALILLPLALFFFRRRKQES